MLNNSIYAILTTTDIKLPKTVFRGKKSTASKTSTKKKLNIVPKTQQQQKNMPAVFQ